MAGAQALVALAGAGAAAPAVRTYNITGYVPLGKASTPLDFPATDLAADAAGGKIRVYGKLQLRKGMKAVNQVWQVGASSTGGAPDKHAFQADNLGAKSKLVLAGKAPAAAEAPSPALAPEAGGPSAGGDSGAGASSSTAPSKSPNAAVPAAGVSAPALLALALVGFLAALRGPREKGALARQLGLGKGAGRGSPRAPGGHVKTKGTIYLSNIRMVFVASKPVGNFFAFDMPLLFVHGEKFNQPIFHCNNISGFVEPVVPDNQNRALYSTHTFKILFKEGGCGTFVPLFLNLTASVRRYNEFEAQSAANMAPRVDPLQAAQTPVDDMMHHAYVDPNDPTKIYLQQPAPESQLRRRNYHRPADAN
ncbi:Auxin-induced in root cultures protein 12 [Zea mays]|uniref:Auxin-induced in root cultures protein 12 n=1 Tax=Zea mays TaxID=4577 RepID=A0A317Y5X7_MAIZE|nr:Auxin-induced in root cultures protein 12 [Zea mays]